MINGRLVIKFAGESGQGINSSGELLVKALKNSGFYVFGYREYPSLIKGGYASYQIEVSDKPINSASKQCELLVCLSRVSVHKYLPDLSNGGRLIHTLSRFNFTKQEQEFIESASIKVEYVDALQIVEELHGNNLMINVLLMGMVWQLLNRKLDNLSEEIIQKFASKPKLLEKDLEFLNYGYNYKTELNQLPLDLPIKPELKESKVTTGNYTLSLGAINAGVRAVFSYPMTPASSILSYLAKTYHDTGIVIKQAEDEITAVQMAIGAMFAGTRSLVATSGGGFDLMTETISLAGITETPLVCVLAQRPGPATGLPTWTGSGDLNIAVYSAHGEFPRIVIAASDANSAYTLIQSAYNFAEEFQIPVIVLTEKQIAESLYQMESLPDSPPIRRHLIAESELSEVKPEDRFKITDSGVSPRWLPGQSEACYNANSDEHDEAGNVVEDAEPAKAMIDKRMRKLNSIATALPEPVLYGNPDAKTTLVGWGSVKSVVLDALEFSGNENINYLHYDYIFPLKVQLISELNSKGSKLIPIENNYLAQLANLITATTGINFEQKFTKYDGRPFYLEEILEIISSLTD